MAWTQDELATMRSMLAQTERALKQKPSKFLREQQTAISQRMREMMHQITDNKSKEEQIRVWQKNLKKYEQVLTFSQEALDDAQQRPDAAQGQVDTAVAKLQALHTRQLDELDETLGLTFHMRMLKDPAMITAAVVAMAPAMRDQAICAMMELHQVTPKLASKHGELACDQTHTGMHEKDFGDEKDSNASGSACLVTGEPGKDTDARDFRNGEDSHASDGVSQSRSPAEPVEDTDEKGFGDEKDSNADDKWLRWLNFISMDDTAVRVARRKLALQEMERCDRLVLQEMDFVDPCSKRDGLLHDLDVVDPGSVCDSPGSGHSTVIDSSLDHDVSSLGDVSEQEDALHFGIFSHIGEDRGVGRGDLGEGRGRALQRGLGASLRAGPGG